MKILLLSFLICFSLPEESALDDIRTKFFAAARDVNQRKAFYVASQKLSQSHPLQMAYIGAANAMMAEVVYNPYSKWKYFSDGKELIESAILKQPANAEIRFIRYLIQCNAPDFLEYNGNVPLDLKIIETAIRESNTELLWMQHFEQFQNQSTSN